jgi:hypothetical protein
MVSHCTLRVKDYTRNDGGPEIGTRGVVLQPGMKQLVSQLGTGGQPMSSPRLTSCRIALTEPRGPVQQRVQGRV